MTISTSKSRFAALAQGLGFEAVRVCRADEAWDAAGRLEAFVEAGRHGTMGWMETTLERRKQPTNMWPEAKSALVVAMNYGPDSDPLEDLKAKSTGNISVYARHRDYHDVMKGRLKQLAQAFARETGAEVKVFVDTAPLMEKPLAEKAGLGWQGKHTNLVSRAHGSWLFLGVMLTTAALEADAPGQDHCGACRACLDICPTDAFPAPYQLDARRCISYLTIEHAGPIPEEFRKAMGNRIYGCDDCLAICPWNKFAKTSAEAKLQAREDLKRPPLAELLTLDDAGFRRLFSGSPIKRIGRNRFVRNCLIAAGNSGDAALRPLVEGLRSDPDPVVAEAADWAAGELGVATD
ncbi:tRNA epoxyqueuosine(34) reductase QueG [Hyphobacterium sp.]|jgi:epoxyqueuosine reductase|uniref:tRNA epoxyqueuosine(34) reductase QueG n=1 Tax=Hyphobacterium sp. TaxID=2004662 RepID=UPI003BAD3EA9